MYLGIEYIEMEQTKPTYKQFSIVFLWLISWLLITSTAYAESVGKIIVATGDCRINGKHAGRGSNIDNGDTLSTGADGSLQFRGLDNSLTDVRPNSVLKVDITPKGDATENTLTKGALISLSGKARAPAKAGSTKLAVHGTCYSLSAGEIGSGVMVWSGDGTVTTARGEALTLGPEQSRQVSLVNSNTLETVTMNTEVASTDEVLNSEASWESSPELEQEVLFDDSVEYVEDENDSDIDSEAADANNASDSEDFEEEFFDEDEFEEEEEE